MTLILSTRSDRPHRLLILGSCVSRDILNFDHAGKFVVADYFARSSIASVAAHPAPALAIDYERIASPFQRRTVQRDVAKDFLGSAVEAANFDAILIDLIDERFDVYEVAPGELVTLSSELLLTEFVTRTDRDTGNWIVSGSERHRALWRGALASLFARLAGLGLMDRVIVNKVFWADSLEDGQPLPKPDRSAIDAANEHLAWMYGEIAKYVPARQWMTFSSDVLKASPGHRWGIAPFHYSDAYYTAAIGELDRLVTSLAPPQAAIVAPVAGAVPTRRSPVRKFSFLMFRAGTLVHSQPYSDSPEIRFDAEVADGPHDLVALILSFDPAQPHQQPQRKMMTYPGTCRADWRSVEQELRDSFGGAR